MNADGSNPTQITFNELDDEDPAGRPAERGSSFNGTSTPSGARLTMTFLP